MRGRDWKSSAWIASGLVALTPARGALAEERVYSVIVGNNQRPEWEPALPALRYADDDAVRYHQLLSTAGDSQLLTVLDEASRRRYPELAKGLRAATPSALASAVEHVAQALRADGERGDRSTVFFVFSGHGGVDDTGAYALALQGGRLTRDQLFERVVRPLAHATLHLIIDACSAAGVVGVRGAFDSESEAQRVSLSEAQRHELTGLTSLARYPNAGALVATASGQEGHEWSRLEAGVFSHEVLSALRGAADANSDRRIDYAEVEAFVTAANRSVSDARAVPHLIALAPRRDPTTPLLDLERLRDTTLLRGALGSLGHFQIELANGQRLLDAHLASQHAATLAVPRGTPAYLRTSDREALLEPQGALMGASDLRFEALSLQARGSVDQLLRNELFRQAYGADYYRGFVDRAQLTQWTRRTDGRRANQRSALVSSLLGASAGVLFGSAAATAYFAIATKRDADHTSSTQRFRELVRRERALTATSASLGAAAVLAAAWATWRLLDARRHDAD